MKKKRKETEHENAERWLLTYADLITLLLGLFVILYAMSKIDAGKYEQLVAAFDGLFGNGGKSVMAGNRGMIEPVVAPLVTERQKIEEELQRALPSIIGSGLVSVSENERGITVHIMEELLFASGNAELKVTSLRALDSLAGLLGRLPNDIRVEGHTDNVPIHNAQFESNWHLSVARAMNTAYYLIGKHQLTPDKVSVAGYSEYHPIVPNISEENRARNRRVDLVIVTDVPHKHPADSTSAAISTKSKESAQ